MTQEINQIKFYLDYDTNYYGKVFLCAKVNDVVYIEVFRSNTLFDWSLRLAKWRIKRKIKILNSK